MSIDLKLKMPAVVEYPEYLALLEATTSMNLAFFSQWLSARSL